MFMSNSVDSADDLVGNDTIVGFGSEGLLCGAAGNRQLIPSPADRQPAGNLSGRRPARVIT